METKNYKNYFLGRMTANDAESLELYVISNNEAEAEMLEAENNLIEDYLDESLTNEEIKAFNSHFLVTDERRERVKFVSLMRTCAEKRKIQTKNEPSLFARLQAVFFQGRLTLAFTVIFLVLLMGIGWQILFNVENNSIETELAALNKQDLSNLDEFKNFNNLSLTAGNLRSGGNRNVLPEKSLTGAALVRLILPNSAISNNNFTVKLSRDGQVLQTFMQRSIQDQEVRVLLPKSILKKGEYQVSLEKDGEKYNYFFAVE